LNREIGALGIVTYVSTTILTHVSGHSMMIQLALRG
jgi:hypothetical protein